MARCRLAYIAAMTRWPGGRWPSGNGRLEESPGSRTTGRRITSARREPRESATESKPPRGFGQGVRVKGWGKSPPQDWQQDWQGKPRPEQDQVGGAHGLSPARAPGVSREGAGNGPPRGMAARPRKGRTEPGLQAIWSFLPQRERRAPPRFKYPQDVYKTQAAGQFLVRFFRSGREPCRDR